MIFETDFMKLYEELGDINNSENNNAFFTSLLDELSEFDYAFIDADGEELDDEEAMKAVVQSPNQLEDLGKGVCTDFVEYTCAKLDDRKIPYEVYYIVCTDKDGDRPSHVFVVVENEGKFLWLEAAWHSEAGIHEYDSLEELFEDTARKHCIYDGENYLKSCEIREIKKSLVGMSQEAIYDYVDTLPITWKAVEEGITEGLETLNTESNIPYRINKNFSAEQLDNYIQQHYGSSEPAAGSIYIAPNGKFISSGDDHANLIYSLETNNLLKKARNYKSFADEYGDVFVDGEVLAVLLGYVRCNTCIGDWAYISLPTRTITSAQGRSIAEWLDRHIYTNRALRSIEVNTDDESHTYQLTDYTSDEVVQKIKRYYASGRLYENN